MCAGARTVTGQSENRRIQAGEAALVAQLDANQQGAARNTRGERLEPHL